MSTDPELQILELRDSVAWAAGVGYERRRISERLRQRASHIDILWEGFNQAGYRMTATELRRIAEELEGME
jgi:hypothetical protein